MPPPPTAASQAKRTTRAHRSKRLAGPWRGAELRPARARVPLLLVLLVFCTGCAGWSPNNRDELKAQVDACLAEAPDGNCTVHQQTYGHIGTWDISRVTNLYARTFHPARDDPAHARAHVRARAFRNRLVRVAHRPGRASALPARNATQLHRAMWKASSHVGGSLQYERKLSYERIPPYRRDPPAWDGSPK